MDTAAPTTQKIISLSVDDLRGICPSLEREEAQALLVPCTKALLDFEITTLNRISAFIAQLSVESDEFQHTSEIWGPTMQQRKYEPPSSVATRLGNVRAGDGYRFRGRGYIQITGRGNYRKYGAKVGIDLEKFPERASEPDLAFRLAGLYWDDHGCNAFADVDNLKAITKQINGGLTHHVRRLVYYQRAKRVLGAAEV